MSVGVGPALRDGKLVHHRQNLGRRDPYVPNASLGLTRRQVGGGGATMPHNFFVILSVYGALGLEERVLEPGGLSLP